MAGIIDDDMAPITGINVTPMVDVVLVLLVIFMITAPVLMKDTLGIRLPKAATSEHKAPVETLGVAVTRQGQLMLNGQVITAEALSAEAARLLKANPEAQAILSADADARHGDVVKAIALIKTSGITRFAIQVERQ